ncbi:GNAT family N-acetyltransferase [Vreelandella titanicae]
MVAPQYRRHGIGACMASALEKVARNLDFKAINIDPLSTPVL